MYGSTTCITTARTSPFALVETAFLLISVVLIFSHKSDTGDESILAQDFRIKDFLWDICHGIVTGLAIFFATLACCAALHREFQYVNGCITAWKCSRGSRKLRTEDAAGRLPKVTQSINLPLLLALGLKAALILIVFNILVPLLVLKASRQTTVQLWSAKLSDTWINSVGKFERQHLLPRVVLPSNPAATVYATWEGLTSGAAHGLHRIASPELADRIEETISHTWQAFRVLVALLYHLIGPPLLTMCAVIWRGLCLLHLQGTKLFPFEPYTLNLGLMWLQRGYATLHSGLTQVMSLPHSVLHPWLLLSLVATTFMAPMFASEALILKQNIGGVMLPLLMSTLAANHVTSLLIFDIVRVLASADLRSSNDHFDALAVVSRMNEARGAAAYFRAFQTMTALSIATVVVLASNMKGMSAADSGLPTDTSSSAQSDEKQLSGNDHLAPSQEYRTLAQDYRDTTPPSAYSTLHDKGLDRSERMPYIPEAEEDAGIGSENLRHPPSNTRLHHDSDTSFIDRGGKSSNIDDSSVQEVCEDRSPDLSDVSSSASSQVDSPLCSAQNISPPPISRRSEVASGIGNMEKTTVPDNRRKSTSVLDVPAALRQRHYVISDHRTSEGSTSSEPSALLRQPPPKLRSQIPERPRFGRL